MTSIRGVDLASTRSGRGRSLVWGHGLTSSRNDENEFGLLDFDALVTTTDLLRYDARGHGESSATDDPASSSWAQMALDQLALADELGIGTYIAGGASLGAATALHAAVAAPERIDGLILVIPPTGWETRATQVDMYEKMASIIESRGVGALLAAPPLPPPDPFVDDTTWDQRRIDRLKAADPKRLAAQFRGAGTADLPARHEIEQVDVPTLILAWSGDAGHPVSTAVELAGLLPANEMHIASTPAEFAQWTARCVSFIGSLPTGYVH